MKESGIYRVKLLSLPVSAERGRSRSSHGSRRAVNTAAWLASWPHALGAVAAAAALCSLFLPATSVIPVQITVPERPPLPRVLTYVMVPLLRKHGDERKAKEKTKGKIFPRRLLSSPSTVTQRRAGSGSLCCPAHTRTHQVGEGHPRTAYFFPPHRTPLRKSSCHLRTQGFSIRLESSIVPSQGRRSRSGPRAEGWEAEQARRT